MDNHKRIKIQDLPVTNPNTKFNNLKIKRKTIAEQTVYTIAAAYNKIYDEKGRGFQDINLAMLAKAAEKRYVTVVESCGCLTGANRILEGVFIKGMHDLPKDPERSLNVKKFNLANEEDMKLFLTRIRTWCYDPGSGELAKLAARKFDDVVWYRAFEPYFSTLLPDTSKLSQEYSRIFYFDLVILFKRAFLEWSQTGFNKQCKEYFNNRINGIIGLIQWEVKNSIRNKAFSK